MAYVTAAEIDEQIGSTWAEESSKPALVKAVNAWIFGVLKKQPTAAMHEAVTMAAGVIAPLAARGVLFKATGREVLSKSSDANGVKTSRSYAAGSVERSAEENIAIGILSPWLGGGVTVARMRKM